MKEALYYKAFDDHVECLLCPHNCKLKEGKTGICRVRKNIGQKLFSENYGLICSLHSDPIEKKPFYHFFPGRNILSVGSFGCNLRCDFCQNWEISQTGCSGYSPNRISDPASIVDMADRDRENIGLAYTYNEPTVWFEFMFDMAVRAKEKKLKNVMVTNGFIDEAPLAELLPNMDAFSVDLKAFTDEFYRSLTSSWLDPVLQTLKAIHKSGRHLEITNLVISNRNDDMAHFTRMVDWIADELDDRVVLHLSRYFPAYKLKEPVTPEATLLGFFRMARKRLKYVYLGNIRTGEGQNTYCPSCNTMVISRSGYLTEIMALDHTGHCLNCNEEVIRKESMVFN